MFHQILIAHDGSDSARKAFDAAVQLAARLGAQLRMICVEEEIVDFNLGIVGHPDLICRLKGDRWPRVVDFKTPITKNALWAVQISVYDYLARKFLNSPVEHSGALRLRGDGGQAKFDEVHDPDRWFAAFLEAMDFQKQIEEGF